MKTIQAFRLGIGSEFSVDGGITWLVVRTEPKYVSTDPDCLTLRFLASPEEVTSLGACQEIRLEESDTVLCNYKFHCIKYQTTP